MIPSLFPLARPLLQALDAEVAHQLTIRALSLAPLRTPPVDDPRLGVDLFGRHFPNPVGLAAGFDKQCEVPDALLALGFGFVELGGVVPNPQPGNPRPRVFRLPRDEAVINRLGLNSDGLEAARERLAGRRRRGVVGVNIGANKDSADRIADYVACTAALAPLVDFVAVNVSSPNTPGLRDLQGRDSMRRIVLRVQEARDEAAPERRPPLFVKLAPDLDESGIADAGAVALETGLDGLIMGNTTLARPPELASPHRGETGGLSGRPLLGLATRRLAELYRATGGRVPLVGTGGVASGADAYAKIRAGASLVQLYSALVFEGPGLPRRINRDLAALLRRDGFTSVAEAVGADHR